MDSIKSKNGKIEPVELSIISHVRNNRIQSNIEDVDKSSAPLEVSSSKFKVSIKSTNQLIFL